MYVCIYLRKYRSEENIFDEEVLGRHQTTLLTNAKKDKLNALGILLFWI